MLLVKKFGGTSVGSIDRIKKVAEIVVNSFKQNNKIIVVISAMRNVTDDIYKKLSDTSLKTRNLREFDQAMATGEQVSASLLSIAICELGMKSKSYNAFNLPIYGEGEYGDGYITHINSTRLKEDLENNIIPVITGFQGFKRDDNSFITLGRGGSDYSAVMVAASMNADLCYIYTDVNGVYTADPRIEKNAVKINELSYDEIIEASKDGAKILQAKSVIAAKKYNITLKVLSSFEENEGTMIANKVIINREKHLKIISCNDNLFYYECDNKNNLDVILDCDFIYQNDDSMSFVLISKIQKYLLKGDFGIIDDIVKITVMSLEKDEILDSENVRILCENNKIDFLVCCLFEKKIVLVAKVEFKEGIIRLLHEFYNDLQSKNLKKDFNILHKN
jgi:aspartate kinase